MMEFKIKSLKKYPLMTEFKDKNLWKKILLRMVFKGKKILGEKSSYDGL